MSDWQTIAVGLIVVLAATYVAWKVVREWRGKKACGGCGCATPANDNAEPKSGAFVPADELHIRKRD